MQEKKWNGVLHIALLVHEMDIDWIETLDFDLSLELRDSVEFLLSGSPVEFFDPVFGQGFDFFPGGC